MRYYFILISCFILFLSQPTNVSAIENNQVEAPRVNLVIEFNSDKQGKPLKGHQTRYLLMRNFSYTEVVSIPEGQSIEFKTFLNDTLVKTESIAYDTNVYFGEPMPAEYYFGHVVFTDYNEAQSFSFSDTIKIVITSFDANGAQLEQIEKVHGGLTSSVPDLGTFCKSPKSYQQVSYPIQLCESVRNDTQDKKIEENSKNIKENKEKIEKNTEAIKENKEEIEAVKESLAEVEQKVVELNNDLISLKAEVKVIKDDVAKINEFILSFNNHKLQEGHTRKEIWYREIKDDTEETSAFIQFLFGKTVHAEEDWFRVPWTDTTTITFQEEKQYEVFFVSEDQNQNESYVGYTMKANSKELISESLDGDGPFHELDKTETIKEEVVVKNEVALAEIPEQSNQTGSTILLLFGLFGMLVLGLLVGLYITKRDQIHRLFKK